MDIHEINSHDELISNFQEGSTNYLLLYKRGAEISDCAKKNIKKALNNVENTNLFIADVNKVKDIHPKYNITTAPSLLKFENNSFISSVKGCHKQGYYKSLFENNTQYAQAGNNLAKKVKVYTTPTCSWCNTLKSYLKKNNIRFTEIDVSKDEKMARAMVRKSGQQGVPQTEINGKMIVGFDKSKINGLLNING